MPEPVCSRRRYSSSSKSVIIAIGQRDRQREDAQRASPCIVNSVFFVALDTGMATSLIRCPAWASSSTSISKPLKRRTSWCSMASSSSEAVRLSSRGLLKVVSVYR